MSEEISKELEGLNKIQIPDSRKESVRRMLFSDCFVMFHSIPSDEGEPPRMAISFDGFNSVDNILMWLQENVFQDWRNPIFQELRADMRRGELNEKAQAQMDKVSDALQEILKEEDE